MEEEVISLANALLDHAVVPRHVTAIKQCNSTLFSQLYEALTGSRVPGMVSQAPTSEAVKCQTIINALNRHLTPHVNLDHIRGIDLVSFDLLALRNLLDIFSVLFHLPRTFNTGYEDDDELEGSELEGGGGEETVLNDSNLISTEGLSVISEVLCKELGGQRQESTDTDSTTELLRPVPRARIPPRVTQMTALQEQQQREEQSPTRQQSPLTARRGERSSSSYTTTNSSEQPPSLSVSNIHSIISTDISSSSGEARKVISRVEEPTEVTLAAQPHTPPQSPRHQRHLLKSPLHHSTPHTSTRSRVFHGENAPTLSQAQMPTLKGMFDPPQTTTTTTNPTERLATPQGASHVYHPTFSAENQKNETPVTQDSTTLLQTEESTVLPESSHSEVPNLTITDLHTTTLQDTNMTQHDTLTSVTSTETGATHESGSCSSESERSDVEDDTLGSSSVQYKSRLDEHGAQVRASVLATLYKNYLSELKSKKPRRTTDKVKHAKPQGRKKSKHSRAPLASATRDERDRDGGQPRTPTEVTVGDNLMPLIERDFPFIHVSPSTMHRLMQRQIQQIKALTSNTTGHSQNTSTVKKINEMEVRYRTLLQVIKKELEHTKRMQRQHEQQKEKKKVKSSVSAKRQAAARSRRYFNEYELRLRAKMQRRRTREEQVFKKAFEEGLELQRERVREVRRYTKEKQEQYAKHHQDQLESMENYYRDQFAMLAESTAREREEATVRERAQHQVVCRMKHELRKKIEDEIKQLQECIDREEDVIHFRELDSEQLRHKLSRLTFTAAVK